MFANLVNVTKKIALFAFLTICLFFMSSADVFSHAGHSPHYDYYWNKYFCDEGLYYWSSLAFYDYDWNDTKDDHTYRYKGIQICSYHSSGGWATVFERVANLNIGAVKQFIKEEPHTLLWRSIDILQALAARWNPEIDIEQLQPILVEAK